MQEFGREADTVGARVTQPLFQFTAAGGAAGRAGLDPASRGEPGPRDLIGARVEISRQGAPPLWRRARSDGSYASANDPRVLVGLGDSAAPVGVKVQWPDGKVEQWTGVAVDRWVTLEQGTAR